MSNWKYPEGGVITLPEADSNSEDAGAGKPWKFTPANQRKQVAPETAIPKVASGGKTWEYRPVTLESKIKVPKSTQELVALAQQIVTASDPSMETHSESSRLLEGLQNALKEGIKNLGELRPIDVVGMVVSSIPKKDRMKVFSLVCPDFSAEFLQGILEAEEKNVSSKK